MPLIRTDISHRLHSRGSRPGLEPRPRRRSPVRKGQALVEMAVVLPLLLLVLLLTVDLARAFYENIQIANAAREGAQFGSRNPTCHTSANCANPANITYVARQEVGGDTTVSVSVSCGGACASSTNLVGNTITVTATKTFTPLFGFILPSVTMTHTSTGVIQ